MKKKEKIGKLKKKFEKKGKVRKKKGKVRKKKKKSSVDHCYNPQCFVCGETMISPYHLESVAILSFVCFFSSSCHPNVFIFKVCVRMLSSNTTSLK